MTLLSRAASLNGEEKKVYGSAFLEPAFEHDEGARKAVKLRYKCRVVRNQCVRPEMWKIVFMFLFLEAPGNAKVYQIESNLYTGRFTYPHSSIRNAQGQVEGFRVLPGESGLFLSVPDNHKDRRVGALSRSPGMFPTLDQEIDGLKDLWKREQISQADLTGETLSIEIARGETVSDLRGWCVHGALPPGNYRVWTITAGWNQGSYKVDFAAPEEFARYLAYPRMAQIATEAFVINAGLFEVLFWDIEILNEDACNWQRLTKWKLVQTDADPGENTWGMKRATVDGKSAIEISNDGTPSYARKGDVIELK